VITIGSSGSIFAIASDYAELTLRKEATLVGDFDSPKIYN
jgi:hypothetical protein